MVDKVTDDRVFMRSSHIRLAHYGLYDGAFGAEGIKMAPAEPGVDKPYRLR